MSLNIPFGIKNLNKHSSVNDWVAQPFTSVADANAGIPEAIRGLGLTCFIQTGNTVKEYWYNGGTTNAHLVEKTSGGGSGNYVINSGNNEYIVVDGSSFRVNALESYFQMSPSDIEFRALGNYKIHGDEIEVLGNHINLIREGTNTKIGFSDVGVVINADRSITFNSVEDITAASLTGNISLTPGSNKKLYYRNNEVATVDQIVSPEGFVRSSEEGATGISMGYIEYSGMAGPRLGVTSTGDPDFVVTSGIDIESPDDGVDIYYKTTNVAAETFKHNIYIGYGISLNSPEGDINLNTSDKGTAKAYYNGNEIATVDQLQPGGGYIVNGNNTDNVDINLVTSGDEITFITRYGVEERIRVAENITQLSGSYIRLSGAGSDFSLNGPDVFLSSNESFLINGSKTTVKGLDLKLEASDYLQIESLNLISLNATTFGVTASDFIQINSVGENSEISVRSGGPISIHGNSSCEFSADRNVYIESVNGDIDIASSGKIALEAKEIKLEANDSVNIISNNGSVSMQNSALGTHVTVDNNSGQVILDGGGYGIALQNVGAATAPVSVYVKQDGTIREMSIAAFKTLLGL